MLEITGTLAMIGALSLCLAACLWPLRSIFGLKSSSPAIPRAGLWMIFLLSTAAVFSLAAAFLTDRFNLYYVASHSQPALSSWYKIAAVWAGQEGSLLLWTWMLSGWGVALCLTLRRKARHLIPMTAWIFSAAAAFFLLILIFESNPFVQWLEVYPDGRIEPAGAAAGGGLNPLLHHPLMVIHPPVLFMGYSGFLVPLALAMASLWAGQTGAEWVRLARRWTLAAWLFLTAGIVLGAKWAYVELGWGGYWGWDPVENASFLPWLTGTALLHSMLVQLRRRMFVRWNIVMAVVTFLLCLFGTFLTRSGIVASVHAFSTSSIGLYFILGMTLPAGFCFGLLGGRLGQLRDNTKLESVTSREGAFLFNNLLFLMACLLILVGTLFPVISETLTGRTVTLGVEYYERSFLPVGLLILALMALAPGLRWRNTQGRVLKSLAGLLITGLLAGCVLAWMLGLISPAGFLTAGLIVTVMLVAGKVLFFNQSVWNARRWGGHLTHAGIALIALGLLGSAYEEQSWAEMEPGDKMKVNNYTAQCMEIITDEKNTPEYERAFVRLKIWNNDREVTLMEPERRFYHRSNQATSEVDIHSTLSEDLYAVFSGLNENGQAVVILHRKPLIAWLWIGSLILAAGTILAMMGREPGKDEPR
jgi:cytochrome c-type biogenesis protein CcmF